MSAIVSKFLHRCIQILFQYPRTTIIVSSILLFSGMIGFSKFEKALIFLPGTQVGTVDPADNVQICQQCHSSNDSARPVTVYKDWSGSMMAHSARDPIFYAALAVANKYNNMNSAGEYCIRCHSPSGWLAGHSENFSGQDLAGTDFDGVQCDYCHRSADPLHPDSTVPYMVFQVPGYGNGMHAVQKFSSPKRGPFDSVSAPHETIYDSFQRTSELCGICHDVSNPHYAGDRINQAPFEYAPLERTYSEWAMSWYATQNDSGTCQSCHMTVTKGYACFFPSAPLRTNLARHDLTGGNTFVPDILPDFWNGLDSTSLIDGKQRAVSTLQRAADLDVAAYHSGDTVIAQVRITNLTGHKLPTGYPDGRRMWINLVGTNTDGDTVFQSGAYQPDSAVLVKDNQLKVYEAIQGLTPYRATIYGLQPGPSFHFGINDTILFDNRIPPKGFTNEKFLLRLAEPVGKSYADSQYWDITHYILPGTASKVTATIFYQTISNEYVKFLRDENVGNLYDWNSWGNNLYNSWRQRGKSQPVAMNTKTETVLDSMMDVRDSEDRLFPSSTMLMQNYPNPFNPTTNFEFRISSHGGEFVTLKVYDILGKEIATLVNERKLPGTYTVQFDAGNLSNGVYLYSLSVNGHTQTKKMLLLK